MATPITAGANVPVEEWRRLRLRAIFDHCKWDTQCGDNEVLARFPMVIGASTMRELAGLAESLTCEALTAEKEILSNPQLLAQLGIPAAIQKELRATDADAAHVRVMRFDFHYTTEGWRISEVNADVPGGYVEASAWNALFAARNSQSEILPDPTREYAKAICEQMTPGGLVALAHATVYSEDREVMVHLGRELQRRGMPVCLAAPQNIRWHTGRASLPADFASQDPGFVVRLSPAEWLPSCGEPETWAPWFGESRTALSNPGRAVVLQSKRFPLAWDGLKCGLTTWRTLLPESRCASTFRDTDCGEWVVKPAFGRVGEDVGIAGVTHAKEYREILRSMRRNPKAWVAQKRFEVLPVATEDGDVFPCIGVYTVNGKFAGFYGRAARSPLIDASAMDVAVVVRGDATGSVQ